MKIALVSLNQVWENKEANKILCEDKLRIASLKGTDLIVFPELTLTGFTMQSEKIHEEIDNSASIDFFRQRAIKYKIGIVFGACLKEIDKYFNCAVFISPMGELKAIYKKIHPFSYAGEDQYYSSGDRIATFNLADFQMGLSICYDLRFPELYRLYADNCQMVINIANWPQKRIDHWWSLLKARAIENQFIIIGVNRVGTDGNQLSYTESSGIFMYDGSTSEPIERIDEMNFYEINIESISSYRRSFPVLQDRRKELYNKLERNVK